MNDMSITDQQINTAEASDLGFWGRKAQARQQDRARSQTDDEGGALRRFITGHTKLRYWLNVSAGTFVVVVSSFAFISDETEATADEPPSIVEAVPAVPEQHAQWNQPSDQDPTPARSDPPVQSGGDNLNDPVLEVLEDAPPVLTVVEDEEEQHEGEDVSLPQRPQIPPIPVLAEIVHADGRWHDQVTDSCTCLLGRHLGSNFLAMMIVPTARESDEPARPLVLFQVQEPEFIDYNGLVATITMSFEFPNGRKTTVSGAGWIENGVLNVHAGDSRDAVHSFQWARTVTFAFDASAGFGRVRNVVYIKPIKLNQSLATIRGLRPYCPALAHYPERPAEEEQTG